jgi:CRISPR-associated protein Cmr4
MDAKLYFIHAISPLHAGTGQGVGVIDLPIARERATDLPYMPGSSVKGPLRDATTDPGKQVRIFGPQSNSAADHASSLSVGDARLLLFAWVTCPLVLTRLLRDARNAGETELPPLVTLDDVGECKVATNSKLGILRNGLAPHIYLEDLDLKTGTVTSSNPVDDWGTWLMKKLFSTEDEFWREFLKARLCIVSDEVLKFLCQTALEVTARIALEDDTKTVKKGQLWYEEALPTESILSGIIGAVNVKATPTEVFDHLEKFFNGKTMQFGGKATVGRGMCRLVIGSPRSENHANT